MGAATGLRVRAGVDEPDLLALRDAALVDVEAVAGLCLVTVEPLLAHGVVLHHELVGPALDCLQLVAADRLVVVDIQPRAVGAFLCAGLSDVVAKHLPGGVPDQVGRGVVAHMLPAALAVDCPADELAGSGVLVGPVDDDVVDNLNVADLRGQVVCRERAVVCRLAPALRVEHRLVEDDIVAVLALEGLQHHRLELHARLVVVIKPLGLGQVRELLGRRGRLGLLVAVVAVALCDQRVEVVWNRHVDATVACNLLDGVWLDTVRVVQFDEFVGGNRLSLAGVLLGE